MGSLFRGNRPGFFCTHNGGDKRASCHFFPKGNGISLYWLRDLRTRLPGSAFYLAPCGGSAAKAPEPAGPPAMGAGVPLLLCLRRAVPVGLSFPEAFSRIEPAEEVRAE